MNLPWTGIARAAVSAGLFGVALVVAGPDRILAALRGADGRWVAAGLVVWVAILLLNVGKWTLVSRAQGLGVGYRKLLNAYFCGMFANMFLPSSVGGDVLRAYETSRSTSKGGGAAAASVVIDRFLSLFALLLFGGGAWLAAPDDLRVIPWWVVGLLSLGAFAGLLAILRADAFGPASRWLARWPRLHRFSEQFLGSAASLRGKSLAVLAALGLGGIAQFLAVLMLQCFILATGQQVPLGYTACFYPILALAASLPITVNGMGVREGGLAYFLGQVGVPAGKAVLIGLLTLSMVLLAGLWGGLVFFWTRNRPDAGGRSSGAAP